ncbi:MAG: D-glycero-beta-D-manno-heptose 1,7-bisphosphate 7-phosphatase [Campylobacterota bacterium]|nr:D-glycero-beta-D-manno-heptose 1,7-bisphosphate 7-phosphatase [Campylobacterota bacterium]
MEKVVFLDRDGVINIEKDYLYKIEDFEFIDGVLESLKYLQKLGYKLVVVTNQSGIGRGYYTKNDFDILTSWMIEKFKTNKIAIEQVYCCPHAPNQNCNCRKPKIGMIEETAQLFDIDYKNSWVIGDKSSDIQLAINANIPNTIQVKSGHSFDEKSSKAKYIIGSIAEVNKIILN